VRSRGEAETPSSWEDEADAMGGSDDDGGAAGALHSVEGCPALRVLSLARCPLVSGAGAARLARCSRLQEVDLSHCTLLSDDAARRPPAARPPQGIFVYFSLLYVTLLSATSCISVLSAAADVPRRATPRHVLTAPARRRARRCARSRPSASCARCCSPRVARYPTARFARSRRARGASHCSMYRIVRSFPAPLSTRSSRARPRSRRSPPRTRPRSTTPRLRASRLCPRPGRRAMARAAARCGI
jgi:hypothetical protein